MLSVKVSGSTRKTERFLIDAQSGNYNNILSRYGQLGVDSLSAATPVDTGETASSWRYKIVQTKTGLSLQWFNDAMSSDDGVPIVILLIHGHGTQNGSYVQGYNFVSETMKPIFDNMATQIMKEVK